MSNIKPSSFILDKIDLVKITQDERVRQATFHYCSVEGFLFEKDNLNQALHFDYEEEVEMERLYQEYLTAKAVFIENTSNKSETEGNMKQHIRLFLDTADNVVAKIHEGMVAKLTK